MTTPEEFLVQNIYIPEQGIDLGRGLSDLEDRRIWGKLSLVQVRFTEGALTRAYLGELANHVFAIRPLRPDEISENTQIPTEKDLKLDSTFASEFGFTLIPHFASLHQTADGAIEAWISPVLLPQNHPLADGTGNAVALFTDPNIIFPGRKFHISGERILKFNELILARYIRLTVDDQPLVLAHILEEIAKEDINNHGFRQLKPPEGSPTAQLADLLNPCSGLSLGRALDAIRTLPSCRSIDTVLPVIGLGRWGTLKMPKN